MIQFVHEIAFWGFAIVPVLILVLIWYLRWKKQQRLKWFTTDTSKQMAPNISGGKVIGKFLLIILTICVLLLALARPQFGYVKNTGKVTGNNIVLAVDVSKSMLAQDVQPNRMARTRQAIQVLSENLQSGRIAIVAFAGEAFIQLPITTDVSAVRLFADNLSPNLIATQGTNIEAAITKSIQAFPKKTKGGKAIILITDGESLQGNIKNAVQAAKEKNIRIFTIGIGSSSGAPIPIIENGVVVGYQKNEQGETVITKLNEAILIAIAKATGGKYIKGSNPTEALEMAYNQVGKMDKATFKSVTFTNAEDRYQWLVFIIFFLLIVEILMSEKIGRLWKKLSWLNEKG